MANTKIVLDRQAIAQTFDFGTTAASGQGLVTIRKGTAASSTVGLTVEGTVGIGGDLNLTGNLNITGAVNSQSVTELYVTDKTIRVNRGGTSAGAGGSGLFVEGDSAATIAAITYASGSATKFQIGNGSSQVDIVDISTSQTLTNKILSTGSTILGSGVSGNISGNAVNVTGTVAVGNGGTGATSLTGVLIGNGTSAVTTKTNPSGAFVGDTDVQSLTNKTLVAPKIGQINDPSTDVASIFLAGPALAVNQLAISSAAATGTPTIQAIGSDTNISINLVPKAAGTVKISGVDIVTTTGTQTLTNKTIAGTQITGNISGNAANVTGTVAVANGGSGATTLTGVLIGNGTGAFTTKANPSGAFVGDTDTQTLTNKTLTTPKIGQINDATNNLATLLLVAPVSSVNQMTLTASAAAGTPSLAVTGSDTNISLNLVSKGSGIIQANGVEIVTLTGTQTLTNKSIAGSQITGSLSVNTSGTAANVTGVVAVANGGTSLTTLTANSILIGNGTSAPTFVAPSNSGNVLTSNGTTWISQAAGAPSQIFKQLAVTGTQDGTNKTFALAFDPVDNSELITLNGQTLTPGSSNDYVLTGTALVFQAAMSAPTSTDVIRAWGTA